MNIIFRLSAIFVVLTLFGCTKPSPEAPFCRTTNKTSHNEDDAACVVRVQHAVLLIRHRLSNRFDFPGGGRQGEESLACTAHRETWEETGFNVEVRSKLAVTPKGLALFECHLDAGIDSLPDYFDPPHWATLEVIAVVKKDPFLLRHDELRFPDDLILLRDSYTAIEGPRKQQ